MAIVRNTFMSFLRLVPLIASFLAATSCSGGFFDKMDDTPSQLEAVDLGLPSGTLWASQNLDATHNWDLGGCFAWGETQKKNGSVGYSFLVDGALTAYNFDQSLGVVDEKYILEIQDDAASVILGGNWRIPTKWDCEELYENCVWEEKIIHGIRGFLVSSKVNSNSIFIPSYKVTGVIGPIYNYDYWTSCVSSNNYTQAVYLHPSGKPEFGECDRRNVCYIRPVLARRAPTEGIAFQSSKIPLTAGTSERVVIDFTPRDALDRRIAWTLSDADVAYIDDNGIVTALYPGTVHLTASTPSGLSSEAEITVSDFIIPKKVDLGLPSGTLWADRNIGAIQENDDGLKFAWGEVRPKMLFIQQDYLGPSISSTNYVLASEYDAATFILGDGWKMPTASDFNELVENCDIQYDARHGYYLLTSRSNGGILHLQSVFCWTSTMINHSAIYFHIALTDNGIQPLFETIHSSYRGHAVRPIYITNKANE